MQSFRSPVRMMGLVVCSAVLTLWASGTSPAAARAVLAITQDLGTHSEQDGGKSEIAGKRTLEGLGADRTASSPISAIDSLAALGPSESRRGLRVATEKLTRRWKETDGLLPVAVDSALIIRVWRNEVKLAADCFADAFEDMVADGQPGPQRVRSCLEAARNAESLLPAIRAASRGQGPAVLVITSVGCECTLAACDRMSALFDSLAAANPGSPLARFDEMLLPHLAEGWDLYEAPSWVFLRSLGDVAFILEAKTSEESVIFSEIQA